MRRCGRCGVQVRGADDACPLCHVPLEEGPLEAPEYPGYARQAWRSGEQRLWQRILRFVLVCTALVCGLINLLTRGEPWSLYIVASVTFFLLAERLVTGRSALGIKVVLSSIAVIVYLIAVDVLTGYGGWSLDYLMPLILLATMLTMSSLVLARQFRVLEYLLFVLTLGAIALVSLILLWSGVIRVGWPSLTTGFVAAVLLTGLFIFGDRTMRSELRRKFHL